MSLGGSDGALGLLDEARNLVTQRVHLNHQAERNLVALAQQRKAALIAALGAPLIAGLGATYRWRVEGLERYQAIEWLNFIGTELHKSFIPLFDPATSDDMKNRARAMLTKRFAYAALMLEGRDYLVGDRFSAADGYLFTVGSWAPMVQFDLSAWPVLQAFQARIAARPAVQQAMRDEGLLS